METAQLLGVGCGVPKSTGDRNDLQVGPSLTNRKEQELFESPLISAKVFSSKTKEGTDPSREVTFVDQKISSFTFNTNRGISYTFGVDGSFSTSMGFLSSGTDLQGNYSIELSIPTAFDTNSGLELSINKYVGNGLIVVGATVITFGILPASGGLVFAFP